MLLLQKLRRYTRNLFAVMTLGSVLMLQGCSGGSDDPAQTYGIGGTVSGLTGTVVLQNNGGGDLTMTDNEDFSFGTSFANGTSYAVTVLTNPSGQGCTVSNGSGSVNGATVSNIIVTCAAHQDASGIYTGSAELNTTPTKAMPTDLKGMVYNNHFYIFSVSQHVLYEGSITNITGSEVTGTVDVYVAGVLQDNDASMTGTVLSKSQMTLNVNGTQNGSGTLTLTYNSIYERGATLDRVLSNNEETKWNGNSYSNTNNTVHFTVISLLDASGMTGDGPFNCIVEIVSGATFTIPSDKANIYKFNQYEIYADSGGCTHVGVGFNGYATVVDDPSEDDTLWVALTNGTYSVFSVATH